MGPASRYAEFLPAPSLRRHLVCTWAQTVTDGPCDYPQRVLPDGCVDIVWIGTAPAIVAGPATRSVVVALPPSTTIVGVRFRPGRVLRALDVPVSELRDRAATPLAELWGRPADHLSDAVAEQESVPAKLAAIERALARCCAGNAPGDPLVTSAVAWLAQHPGRPVHRLAHELDVSSRQLQRRFVATVGYGPKIFQRIARFQHLLALGMARRSHGRGLTDLALAAGYADQAHMTREVRALADTTPAALLGHSGSTLEMSELFKTALEPAP